MQGKNNEIFDKNLIESDYFNEEFSIFLMLPIDLPNGWVSIRHIIEKTLSIIEGALFIRDDKTHRDITKRIHNIEKKIKKENTPLWMYYPEWKEGFT